MRAVVRAFLGTVAIGILCLAGSADAKETAVVRLGRHDDVVRVVIETPSRLDFQQSLTKDGRQSTVTLPAALTVQLPKGMIAPLAAIRVPSARKDTTTTVLLKFRVPVELKHAMILPSLTQPGFRLTLDYRMTVPQEPQPKPSDTPAIAVAAAPRAPVAADLFKLAGFRSARFGMTDAQVLEVINGEADPDQSAVRMVVNPGKPESKLIITVNRLVAPFGQVQTVYEFLPDSRRLVGISADWGREPGAGLDNRTVQEIVRALTQDLRNANFRPSSTAFDAPLAGGGRIGFSGIDKAERLATVSIYPLPMPPGEPTDATPHYIHLSILDTPSAQ
jgi:hypothetical protein